MPVKRTQAEVEDVEAQRQALSDDWRRKHRASLLAQAKVRMKQREIAAGRSLNDPAASELQDAERRSAEAEAAKARLFEFNRKHP